MSYLEAKFKTFEKPINNGSVTTWNTRSLVDHNKSVTRDRCVMIWTCFLPCLTDSNGSKLGHVLALRQRHVLPNAINDSSSMTYYIAQLSTKPLSSRRIWTWWFHPSSVGNIAVRLPDTNWSDFIIIRPLSRWRQSTWLLIKRNSIARITFFCRLKCWASKIVYVDQKHSKSCNHTVLAWDYVSDTDDVGNCSENLVSMRCLGSFIF